MSNTFDIVNSITNNKKAEALDSIQALMQATAAEAIGMYKKAVATSYFNEPVEQLETEE
jgi:hypothetical protein